MQSFPSRLFFPGIGPEIPRLSVTRFVSRKRAARTRTAWNFIPSVLKRQQGRSYDQYLSSVDFLSLLAFYLYSFKRQHYVNTFPSLSVINIGFRDG